MEDGPKWHDIRSKVQQDLMRPQSAHFYLSEMQDIAQEFMEFIRCQRTRDENVIEDFLPDIYRFTFEAIACIAMDERLGCLKVPMDPEIARVFQAAKKYLGKLSLF